MAKGGESRKGGSVDKGVRKTWVRSGRGKLRGRHCVKVEVDKAPKSAVKGVKLLPYEFHGCYVSAQKARQVAEKLSKKQRL